MTLIFVILAHENNDDITILNFRLTANYSRFTTGWIRFFIGVKQK